MTRWMQPGGEEAAGRVVEEGCEELAGAGEERARS